MARKAAPYDRAMPEPESQTVDEARALVRDHVRPQVRAGSAAGRYPPSWQRPAGSPGCSCRPTAAALGLGYPEGMRVFEELGRGDAAFAFSLSMHNAVAAAVARRRDAELVDAGPRLAAGERWAGSR